MEEGNLLEESIFVTILRFQLGFQQIVIAFTVKKQHITRFDCDCSCLAKVLLFHYLSKTIARLDYPYYFLYVLKFILFVLRFSDRSLIQFEKGTEYIIFG